MWIRCAVQLKVPNDAPTSRKVFSVLKSVANSVSAVSHSAAKRSAINIMESYTCTSCAKLGMRKMGGTCLHAERLPLREEHCPSI